MQAQDKCCCVFRRVNINIAAGTAQCVAYVPVDSYPAIHLVHHSLTSRANSCPALARRYMTFLPLTLIPIQRKLIDTAQLLPHEVAWIDCYHARVWEEISPRLADDPKTTAWLQEATAPLST